MSTNNHDKSQSNHSSEIKEELNPAMQKLVTKIKIKLSISLILLIIILVLAYQYVEISLKI